MAADRRLRLMFCYLAGFALAVAAVNRLANPFGAWNRLLETAVSSRDGYNRLAVPYRVRVEQPATVLVGSSRVVYGMPAGDGVRDEDFLNAGLLGASLEELTTIVELATANPRLRRLVWVIEFYAFSEQFAGFRDQQTRARLAGEWPRLVTETLFSLDALDASRRELLKAYNPFGGGRARALPLPWPEAEIAAAADHPDISRLADKSPGRIRYELENWVDIYRRYRAAPRHLELFRAAVGRLRARGLDLVLLVPPLSEYELETIRQSGQWPTFLAWKRDLAAVTPYTDFSGYTELARADRYFIDVCHFVPALGHALLRYALGGPDNCRSCGEVARLLAATAAPVDEAAIESHLSHQDSDRIAQTVMESRFARLVSEIAGRSSTTVAMERP